MPTDVPPGKTILVIDDSQVEREGLAAVLREEGYSVCVAEDGARALAMLRAGPKVDVILMDVLLPRMDGWDFLRELRRHPGLGALPVVIVTALGVASPEWAGSLGAAACYRKPYSVGALLERLRRLLAQTPDGSS
jgi:two-component system, chemotaxis family, sensor histidine kinase and response regulator PixL